VHVPWEAEREAVMEKLTFFWEVVGFTGENVAMGVPEPVAGGQDVSPGSQAELQL